MIDFIVANSSDMVALGVLLTFLAITTDLILGVACMSLSALCGYNPASLLPFVGRRGVF